MPEQERLEFILRAVDEVTKTLLSIDRELERVADEGEKTNTKLTDAGKSTTRAFIEVDAILGSVQRTSQILRGAATKLFDTITFGVRQFDALLEVSSGLVREYGAVAKANTTLNSILKATGNLTEENTQRWQDFADSLSDVALVGSEDLLPLIARLGAFSGFNEDLERASRAAVDLSSAFGITVQSAFSKFIKAVNSGSLELAEGVTVQLKATEQAERLGEAVDFVNSKFGGTAEAISKGGAAALTQLEVTLQATRQKLGEVIAESPFFQAFVAAAKKSLEEVIDFLDNNKDTLGKSFSEAALASFKLAQLSAEALATALFAVVDAIVEIGQQFGLIPTLEGTRKEIEESLQRVSILNKEIQKAILSDASQSRQGFTTRTASALSKQREEEIAQLRELREELQGLERSSEVRLEFGESLAVLKKEATAIGKTFAREVVEGTKAGIEDATSDQDFQAELASKLEDLGRKSTERSEGVLKLISAIEKTTPSFETAADNLNKSTDNLAEILSKPVEIAGLAGDGVTQQVGFGDSSNAVSQAVVDAIREATRGDDEDFALLAQAQQQALGEVLLDISTAASDAFEQAKQDSTDGAAAIDQAVQGFTTGQEDSKRNQDAASQAASTAAKAGEVAADKVGVAGDTVLRGAEAFITETTAAYAKIDSNTDKQATNIETFGNATGTYRDASSELADASESWAALSEQQANNLTADAKVIQDFARAVERFGDILEVFGTNGAPRFAQHGAILSRPTLIAGEAGTEVIAPTGARGSALLAQALGVSRATQLRNGGGGGPGSISLAIHANTVNMTSDQGAAFASAFERRITTGLLQRSRLGT
jgi:hypothetical protein